MIYLSYTAAILAPFVIVKAVRVWLNHCEYKRQKLKWYRKVATRQYRRGEIDEGFMRGFAELSLIVLLLIAVFGWMGYSHQ